MCFYEQFVYQCRDWKWGSFRQHCQAGYGAGDACGIGMVWKATPLPEKCELCIKIEGKERRRAKHVDDYNRWRKQPRRYQASIEKAIQDIKALEHEINNLRFEKHDCYLRIGGLRRDGAISIHPGAAASLSQSTPPRTVSPVSTISPLSQSENNVAQGRELVHIEKSLLQSSGPLESSEDLEQNDDNSGILQIRGSGEYAASTVPGHKLLEESMPLLAAVTLKNTDIDAERLPDNLVNKALPESKASSLLTMDLLNDVHEPYEHQMKSALGYDLIGPQGTNLGPGEIDRIACEVSWIPTNLLNLSHESVCSCADTIKSIIEQSLGETWNWWPFAPRLSPLRRGYCRLQWKSVRILSLLT